MAEIIVGFLVLFIIGIFNKKDDSSKHQEHIIPIFFDEVSEKRQSDEKVAKIDPGFEDCDVIDEFEDYDF